MIVSELVKRNALRALLGDQQYLVIIRDHRNLIIGQVPVRFKEYDGNIEVRTTWTAERIMHVQAIELWNPLTFKLMSALYRPYTLAVGDTLNISFPMTID